MSNLLARFNIRSGWMLVLLWFIASFAGGFLYVFPVMAVHFVLRSFGDVQEPTAANTSFVVLAASSVAAVCGLSIGFFQWLVLRREFNKIKLWMVATALGFASLGVLPLLAGIWQPTWTNWAFTLIIDGKFAWLARLEPQWPLASWLPGAVTLTVFGAVLGFLQWIVLRKHVRNGSYWILISSVAWAAAAIGCLAQNGLWNVFGTWNIPVLVTGTGLAVLRQTESQRDVVSNSSRQTVDVARPV